jgi:hypothetical protein
MFLWLPCGEMPESELSRDPLGVALVATSLLECQAILVGRCRPVFRGKFRDCIDRWLGWSVSDRLSAFLLLVEPINGCDILRPRELTSIVNALDVWSQD